MAWYLPRQNSQNSVNTHSAGLFCPLPSVSNLARRWPSSRRQHGHFCIPSATKHLYSAVHQRGNFASEYLSIDTIFFGAVGAKTRLPQRFQSGLASQDRTVFLRTDHITHHTPLTVHHPTYRPASLPDLASIPKCVCRLSSLLTNSAFLFQFQWAR